MPKYLIEEIDPNDGRTVIGHLERATLSGARQAAEGVLRRVFVNITAQKEVERVQNRIRGTMPPDIRIMNIEDFEELIGNFSLSSSAFHKGRWTVATDALDVALVTAQRIRDSIAANGVDEVTTSG